MVHPSGQPQECLARDGETVALGPCRGTLSQKWALSETGDGVVSDPDGGVCLDNMQRTAGPPGLYGCHGGGTQLWTFTGGRLTVANRDVCVGLGNAAGLALCRAHDPDQQWVREQRTLRPAGHRDVCLTRHDGSATLEDCTEDRAAQEWVIGE
jgi:polypeptide N-acetylgalactosaminyltransferase